MTVIIIVKHSSTKIKYQHTINSTPVPNISPTLTLLVLKENNYLIIRVKLLYQSRDRMF